MKDFNQRPGKNGYIKVTGGQFAKNDKRKIKGHSHSHFNKFKL